MERIQPIRKLIKEAAKSIDHPKVKSDFTSLTRVQIHALDFLDQQPGGMVNQHLFEEEMHIQRSTTTVMLQRLEKKRLVIRLPDPSDKRQKLVALTEAGKAEIPKIRNIIIEDDLRLRQMFTDEELAATHKVLEYIRKEG